MEHEEIHLRRANFKTSLKNEVASKFVSTNKFAKCTGINATTLGLIFKNEQGLSPAQLEIITNALGYPPGHYYEEYVDECYINGHIHYTRASEFLYLCFLNNKLSVAEKITKALYEDTDKTKTIQTTLELAERLYLHDKQDESEIYYDYVIKREESFSSRLAIAVMRKYSIMRKRDDVELTKQFLYKLIDLVFLLPKVEKYDYGNDDKRVEYLQSEGYSLITRYFNSIEDWIKVEHYALKLQESAGDKVSYYAESLLYQFSSLRERGLKKEALKLNEAISQINEFYSRIAKGNKMLVEVEAGDQTVIPLVIEWIQNDDELKLFLPVMIECYLRNDNLEGALQSLNRYQHILSEQFHPVKLLHQRRKSRLCVALAEVLFKNNDSQRACHFLSEAIKLSIASENLLRYNRCMLLMMDNLHSIRDQELQLIKTSTKRSEDLLC
ncbi:hypothetical protein ACFVS2_26815 [Brevibacillus sp. NPDC058079]|uniref:hypothetical protein n=1 Tax=Brevibacillus sp. NPDC058079 TaxID=3346330 RepID=UPI0036EFCD08